MRYVFCHLAALLVSTAIAGTAKAQHSIGEMGAMPNDQFAFGESVPASLATRVVRIEMRGLQFAPPALALRQGEVVRFVVVNTGDVEHEFMLGDPATQRAHRAQMADPHGMSMDNDSSGISVAPHQTGTLTWRFSGTAPIEYDCDIPGHYEAGMHGTIKFN